ncbi:hypothetical protein [Pseudomonas anguilliseptica]|uniref:Uncharacterized protein n=1 Tax=Pseudomonas anguilliseptica TaxID=53406 RepID=A0A1H4XXM6_PSEAG|nr:hypothetical protein [Pseudomonas anguilliseptica]SED10512.1 hypothetical protein SAMN05421553_2038 [Pseudomonas anguilliseptica]
MNLGHAIAELTIVAENATHNAPIHEAEGNHAQAELSRAVADECQQAIAQLEEAAQ